MTYGSFSVAGLRVFLVRALRPEVAILGSVSRTKNAIVRSASKSNAHQKTRTPCDAAGLTNALRCGRADEHASLCNVLRSAELSVATTPHGRDDICRSIRVPRRLVQIARPFLELP